MKKKIFAALLSLCMVLTLIPVTAHAEDTSAAATTGTVKVGETTYEGATAFEDAVAANIKTTDPVTMLVSGNVTWTTGAEHGSTPFDMATNALTIEGVADTDATFTAVGQGVGPVGQDSGTVTFKNITIKDESVSYAEGNWEFGYLEFRGDITFEGCTFVNAIQIDQDNGQNVPTKSTFINCTFNSNNANEYDVWIGQDIATFTGCTFEGYRGAKIHEAYGGDVESVTFDNCTFKGLTKKPGIAIGDLNAGTTVTVKNSTIIDCQPGDQGKYIYESDTDVTAFNLVLENNDVTCSQHTLIKTDAVAAQCEATGNIAYWTCSVCSKIFSDEAATTQVTLEETVTAATGHTEKTVSLVAPTCTVAGYTGDVICDVCHVTLSTGEIVPVIDHKYENGACTACAAPDPDYVPEVDAQPSVDNTETENVLQTEADAVTEEIINGTITENENVVLNEEVDMEAVTQEVVAEEKKIVTEVVVAPVAEGTVPKEEVADIKTSLESEAVNLESEEKVEGSAVAQYFDINVLIKAQSVVNPEDEIEIGKHVQTKDEIIVEITIPEELQKEGRIFFVLRNHNGEVKKLDLIDTANGKKAFATNLFSTYALAYVDVHVHTETVINAVAENCGDEGYTGDTVCATCGEELAKGSVIQPSGEHHWSDWMTEAGYDGTVRKCWTCGDAIYQPAGTVVDTAVNAPAAAPSTGAPATGDTSNVMTWIAMLAISCAVLVGAKVYRKNR